MDRRLRPGTSSRAPEAVVAAVLVLAVVVMGVLAVRLHLANRSHREAAEGALRHHAATAAWQLARHIQLELERTLLSAARFGMLRSDAFTRPAQSTPDLDLFQRAVEQDLSRAGVAGSARGFLVLDLATGERWSTLTEEPVARNVARVVQVDLRQHEERPPRTALRRRFTVEGEGTTEVEVAAVDRIVQSEALGVGDAVVYAVVHDHGGAPARAYAILVDGAAVAGELARQITGAIPLLPPGLAGGMPNQASLSMEVVGGTGDVVFASGAEALPGTRVTESLQTPFAGTRVSVGILPEAADRLVVGGLPRTAIPLLALLLATGVTLAAVGVVQLRRHRQLALLRSDFVAGVSHELRTPLSQIRLFADLLTDDGLEAGERRRSIEIIGEEASRLGFLVDNILSFSSRAEREATSASEVQDLTEVAEEAAEAFSPLAATAGATIRLDVPEGGVPVRAHRHALKQMLLNLLDNAVKYGPRGQTVTVRVALDARTAVLEVEDEGPGIPAQERDRVLQPYHRLPRDVNRGIGGSGIGLALVEGLAVLYGGRVRVEDAPARGACVRVELPLAGDSAPEVEPA